MKPETNLLRRVHLNGDPERLPPRDKDSENSIIVFIGRNDTPEGRARYAFDTNEWFDDQFRVVIPEYWLTPVPREEIMGVLKKAARKVDDSDYHEEAIFDEMGNFASIADEIIGGE